MDHWNNDTCVGKYLKTIYEQRINKNKKSYNGDRNGQFSVSQYTKKYGGQFHFDIIGLAKKKILAMDGFGGQQVIVDFDSGRIIVVHSLDRHYNWKKIVHKKSLQLFRHLNLQMISLSIISLFSSSVHMNKS